MKDSTKLVVLADACSDVLIGGECGWEQMDFNEFVAECRKAIAYGGRCRAAGLAPPPKKGNLPKNRTEEAL